MKRPATLNYKRRFSVLGTKAENAKVFLTSGKRWEVYEQLLHCVFLPMTRGLLKLILPDGERLDYGDGSDGVEATIRVNNYDFFKKCVLFGDVGFGEAYVDGDWETEDITKVIEWMILNVENHPTMMADRQRKSKVNFLKIFNTWAHLLRENTTKGSKKNISVHYDLGNDFYELFLDATMTYSSAYFRNSNQSLAEAQVAKYDQLCHKLRLKSTDHVLEIGSGWGGFAIHAAKNYGCTITTITISRRQFEYARQRIQTEGLEKKIHIQFRDYRDVKGKFDKIVSIEMIEAVGHRFLKTFFQQCHRCLKSDGLLGIQAILSPDHRYESFRRNADWIQKHIFPGSLLPSFAIIQRRVNETGTLCLWNYEDMTSHYVRTLNLWRQNFHSRLEDVQRLGFGETFVRKWNYYLSYCEAAFKMRNISVAQFIFTRPNNFGLIS